MGWIMNASQILFKKLSPIFNGKVYPMAVPETQDNTLPYAVYNIISTAPDNSLDGITGHEWARVQIDIYHNDYDELLTLNSKVISELNTITPSIYGGTQLLTENNHSSSALLFRAMIEYEFWQSF